MAEDKKTVAKKDVEKVEHKNIYAAFSAFQGELEPIEKSARVNFKTKAGETVDFKYAPLEKTMETLYPLLAKHGLCVRHELGDNWVEAILSHESYDLVSYENRADTFGEAGNLISQVHNHIHIPKNELRSGKLIIDTKKADMKDVGGQITYARRYTLGLVLGLATEEDKDAQLFDKSKENLEAFAFKQARTTIEKTNKNELDKQIEFLVKELDLAEKLENGEGEKAPSLGLSAKQYKELLNLAKGKKGLPDVDKTIE